jgi:hypothetical protein
MVVMTFNPVSFDPDTKCGKAIHTAAVLTQEATRAELLDKEQVHREPELNCCIHFSENHRTRPARNEAQVEKAEVLLRHQIAKLKRSSRSKRSPKKSKVKGSNRKCETCGNIHTSFPITGIMKKSADFRFRKVCRN